MLLARNTAKYLAVKYFGLHVVVSAQVYVKTVDWVLKTHFKNCKNIRIYLMNMHACKQQRSQKLITQISAFVTKTQTQNQDA